MFCNLCGKNEASYHFNQVIDDSMVSLHICEECARKEGIDTDSPSSVASIVGNLSGEFLAVTQKNVVKCSKCGLTYEKFRKTGRLGCEFCYDNFGDPLMTMIQNVHGNQLHVGKVPHKKATVYKKQQTVDQLQKKLQELISAEKYEDAAKVRDAIKENQDRHDG